MVWYSVPMLRPASRTDARGQGVRGNTARAGTAGNADKSNVSSWPN
jgi:hypothetical protein